MHDIRPPSPVLFPGHRERIIPFLQFVTFLSGIFLSLGNFFFSRGEIIAQENSGVVGYYGNYVLITLFGDIAYITGPLLILVSLRSYFRNNIRYLRDGFAGILILLVSGSALFRILFSSESIAGNYLYETGYLLFGKIGLVIFVVFFFILGVLLLLSLSLQSFFTQEDRENKKQDKTKFWIFLLSLAGILLYRHREEIKKKLREIFHSFVSKSPKFPKLDQEKEMNLKSLFSKFLPEKETQKKPPWIKKVVVEENNPVEEIENKDSIVFFRDNYTDIPERIEIGEKKGNNAFLLPDEQDDQVSPNSTDNEIELSFEKKNNFSGDLKIYFDSSKNRFLFIEKKKKTDGFTGIFDDLDLDPEIESKIQDIKTIDFYHQPDDKKDAVFTKEKDVAPFETHDELYVIAAPNSNTEEKSPHQNRESEIPDKTPDTKLNLTGDSSEELQDSSGRNAALTVKETKTAPEDQNDNSAVLFDFQNSVLTSRKHAGFYKLPQEILKKSPAGISQGNLEYQKEIEENWKKLEKVMLDFGIKGQVVDAIRGPMITMFEVRLEPGVRVSRILSIQDEIRMNLAAVSVRIVAPIPGKTTIGVEIPNRNREFVNLGDLIQRDPEFFSRKKDINIPLGKDVTGKTRYIDLTRLPHLLIAGATGSGKSVFLNSVIASLLYQYSPEYIRFLMIDPKMVELKLFEGIPHLLYPVIIDVRVAEKALFWAVEEMENRYRLLSLAKCRDIRSYNEKVQKQQIKGNILPFIVIIIDELSDLMMIAPKEVEESIIRLTQKARAVGIHTILATQRPSVDVITPLIKANCPARISFQVAQKVDSRIILDTNGAETLLGKGDMLYRSPASTLPVRIQAPNITEEEIERIVKETQKFGQGEYITLPVEESAQDIALSETDEELIHKAWKIILETGKTSTSFIQRRLRIGYNRAANIMEKLEEMGYLSPAYGNKPREILRRD